MKKALVVFLLSLNAFATSFVNRPMGVVLKEAPNIVRGTTGSSHADFEDGTQGRIYTYTELSVVEEIKGKVVDTKILVRQPGGEKNGMEMSVSGVARFSPGQDVVLLLSEQNPTDKSYDVMNFATGKYDVQKTESGDLVLVNSLGGEAVIDPEKGADTQSYNSRINLDTFRKFAQGSASVEALQKNQFAPSASPPPSPVEVSKVHEEKNVVSSPKDAPPHEATSAQTSKNWALIAGLVAAIGVIAFFLLR